MIQHAVQSLGMSDAEDLKRRLRGLADEVGRADAHLHDLVRERNELMRQLYRNHGVKSAQLAELAGLRSRPLASRIANGGDR